LPRFSIFWLVSLGCFIQAKEVRLLLTLNSLAYCQHTNNSIEAKSRVRIYGGAALKPFRYDQVLTQLAEYRSAVTSELIRIQALEIHSFTLSGMQIKQRFDNESNGMYMSCVNLIFLSNLIYRSHVAEVQAVACSDHLYFSIRGCTKPAHAQHFPVDLRRSSLQELVSCTR
jgi:hypothetical protein